MARDRLEQSIALRRQLGNDQGIGWSLRILDAVHESEGDPAAARGVLRATEASDRVGAGSTSARCWTRSHAWPFRMGGTHAAHLIAAAAMQERNGSSCPQSTSAS